MPLTRPIASTRAGQHCDVAIIGAGPAGCALARALAPSHRVVLIDRAAAATAEPRIGESLPAAAAPLLARLGLAEAFAQQGHAQRGATWSIWDTSEAEWRDSLRDPNGPGWHLDRPRFDTLLRTAACDSGATLFNGMVQIDPQRHDAHWSLTLTTDERAQRWHARFIVDASGRRSSVARRLGATRAMGDRLLCLHAFLPPDETDRDQCTRIVAAPYGWWYSVRVPQGGRVVALHVDAAEPSWRNLREPTTFFDAAWHQGVLTTPVAACMQAPLYARAAGGSRLNRVVGTNWLAVGDAAIAFDPLASQGLFHALASAHHASHVVRDCLADKHEAAAGYAAEMRAVWERYALHAALTYAGPSRYAAYPFWATRRRWRDDG